VHQQSTIFFNHPLFSLLSSENAGQFKFINKPIINYLIVLLTPKLKEKIYLDLTYFCVEEQTNIRSFK